MEKHDEAITPEFARWLAETAAQVAPDMLEAADRILEDIERGGVVLRGRWVEVPDGEDPKDRPPK